MNTAVKPLLLQTVRLKWQFVSLTLSVLIVTLVGIPANTTLSQVPQDVLALNTGNKATNRHNVMLTTIWHGSSPADNVSRHLVTQRKSNISKQNSVGFRSSCVWLAESQRDERDGSVCLLRN